MNKEKLITNFLNKFFSLFQAHINNIKFHKGQVIGIVVWDDASGSQEFSWDIPKSNFDYENTIKLIDYLIDQKLVDGDKIILPRNFVVRDLKNLKWNLETIENSLDFLCSVRIVMVDAGKITDHFFVHF